MHLGRRGFPGITVLLILGFALGVGGIAFAGTRPETTPVLTAGRVPDDARRPDGSLDRNALPELISVTDDAEKVVGYIPRDELLRTPEAMARKPKLREGIFEVFDRSGKKLVGHLYPNGSGFLSLDQQAKQGVSVHNPPPTSWTPTTFTAGP
jgi:hypothetical protein